MQMETENTNISKQNDIDCNKKNYNLGFISDKDIFNHVKSTVLQYRRSINLKVGSIN